MIHKIIKQRGLALVQVLLLVAMLSILLMLMIANTQQQQNQIIALQTQLDSHFRLYSQGNDIVFNLLTHRWDDVALTRENRSTQGASISSDERAGDAWHTRWNFYAYPFSLDQYSARIINLNSLVSIHGSGNDMARLLQHLGYNQTEARRLASQIAVPSDAQTDINGATLPSERSGQDDFVPLQHVHELSMLPGWNKELMQRAAPYVTTFRSRLLNEAYMPDRMLEMVLTQAQADIIQNMRQDGRYNRLAFEAVTELSADEFSSFFVGPDFRIEVWHNDAPDTIRVLEVRLLPYQTEAVQFRHRGWGY